MFVCPYYSFDQSLSTFSFWTFKNQPHIFLGSKTWSKLKKTIHHVIQAHRTRIPFLSDSTEDEPELHMPFCYPLSMPQQKTIETLKMARDEITKTKLKIVFQMPVTRLCSIPPFCNLENYSSNTEIFPVTQRQIKQKIIFRY